MYSCSMKIVQHWRVKTGVLVVLKEEEKENAEQGGVMSSDVRERRCSTGRSIKRSDESLGRRHYSPQRALRRAGKNNNEDGV